MISLAADRVDDVLHDCLKALVAEGDRIHPSRGEAIEVRGARLELTNPRARLSRSHTRGKAFSCLGELVWYLAGSGSADQIAFYLPKYRDDAESDGTIHAAYGTRLFARDGRLQAVIDTLRAKRDTRQAVVQLLDAGDLASGYRHVPCTCTLQFMWRGDLLDLVVFMRSNDAYLGLPHDIFSFTMLQELVARTVGAELGTYIHMVGSLHMYERDRAATQRFLGEGFAALRPMPPMPGGDPWEAVEKLVESEATLRAGDVKEPDSVGHPYWDDLFRLLNAFALWKLGGHDERIAAIRESMHDDVYDVFFADRFDASGGY